jgi:UDP-glucose 4-epimerase
VRVVVVGATGNIGSALLGALEREPRVDEVVGIARRTPAAQDHVEWIAADIVSDRLEPHFEGADAVVSLAWRIQPSHRPEELRRTNVHGSSRVFEAAARAGVPTLVYGSSVGAYAPAPKDSRKDESWPTGGVQTSFYARHKAEVESLLDRFERDHPQIRVVRVRPALVFQRRSASEQRRFFLGPLAPSSLFGRGLLPLAPSVSGLRFQVVHASDVADAYRRTILSGARGAFNLAAEPVLDELALPNLLEARPVPLPPRLVRAALRLTWNLRLQPTPPGWLDMGLAVPLLDTARARDVLGWEPRHDAWHTMDELLEGIHEGAGASTPPLDPGASGPLRANEFATIAGTREKQGA